MHILRIELLTEKYPTRDAYPFHLEIFNRSQAIDIKTPVTFFMGENGTGKSTLLKAIATKCGIHMWGGLERSRYEVNPYENQLHNAIAVHWSDIRVPGSFFASEIFHNFAQLLDEWASMDRDLLEYFGGKSLLTQSHGQSLLSFFKSRYRIKGLYLMDEPETALSPRNQLELVKVLMDMTRDGHAQFIIATHSPILLSCPKATILSFNKIPIQSVHYEDTEYFNFYRDFLLDRRRFLEF